MTDAQVSARMVRSREQERGRLIQKCPWVVLLSYAQQDALLDAIMAWAYDDPLGEEET